MDPLDYNPDFQHNPLKDNSKRAEIAIGVFWGVVCLSFIAAVSSYFEYNLLVRIEEGEYLNDTVISFNDYRQAAIGILQAALAIASIVVFLNWFRRAYCNLQRTGKVRTEYPETMAIWGFVIPILSLWYPYKIMAEIWRKCQTITKNINEEYQINFSTPLIGIWWTAYLISNIIGQIAFRASMDAESIAELKNTSICYLISDVVDIPAALITLLLIKKVAEKERDLYLAIGNRPIQPTPETGTTEEVI